MFALSKNRNPFVLTSQISGYSSSRSLKQLISANVEIGMLLVSLLVGLGSCSPPAEKMDPEPAATGEYISYKIDGKEYADKTLGSLGTGPDYFGLWSVIAVSNSFNSPGYSLKLYVDAPKVGTFTTQNDRFTGELDYIKTLSDVQTYSLSSKNSGTLTFTKFDPAGFAEGSFSFVGKTDKGQTLTVTDGKFKIDLR